MQNPEDSRSLYVGLMSGTSMDGIDAALVQLGDRRCKTIATTNYPYPGELRAALLTASRNPANTTVDTVADLDHWVGICFRDAAIAMLDSSATDRSQVRAIGSHGQTIRHQPRANRPFTLQLGDPNLIASGTGLTTVADFRRRDLALGGEGAPLTPAFHHWLFADDDRHRVVLNIGGIANITILPANSGRVIGFDTGPGNGLMDAWIQEEKNSRFDEGGSWAAEGYELPDLLGTMLADDYFALPPPKSTGFEYFNLHWLGKQIKARTIDSANIQKSLLMLTVRSIENAIKLHAPDAQEILVCGGGVHNTTLMSELSSSLSSARVTSTGDYGLDPDWVEAAAFAWLARQTLLGLPGNLPSVTGAVRADILGGIYQCAT